MRIRIFPNEFCLEVLPAITPSRSIWICLVDKWPSSRSIDVQPFMGIIASKLDFSWIHNIELKRQCRIAWPSWPLPPLEATPARLLSSALLSMMLKCESPSVLWPSQPNVREAGRTSPNRPGNSTIIRPLRQNRNRYYAAFILSLSEKNSLIESFSESGAIHGRSFNGSLNRLIWSYNISRIAIPLIA